MNNCRIKLAFAVGIAGALAIGATTPVYAQLPSDRKAVEQNGSSGRLLPEAFLVLGGVSENTSVSPVFSSRNQATEGLRAGLGAYTTGRLDERGLNNKGPDEYFAPTYRDGKCVEDEGDTLLAEPTPGGGVRRMDGISLARALALLCRKAGP